MQSKTSFIAGLFVIALCAFVAGGINFYEYIDYRRHNQPATMELADPDKNVVLFDDVLDTRTLDVKYVSPAGEILVPQKLLSLADAERLVAGEKISIIYLTNNPKRTFGPYHQTGIPWIWLLLGPIALATAVFALRMHKREQQE